MTVGSTAAQASGPGGLPYPFLSVLADEPRARRTRQAHAAIRHAIVNLALQPGEFLHREAICERLGVTRFSLSEVLGNLAEEGFVEILPQRGTRVSHIDIAACRLPMLVRRTIEGDAMRVLAPRTDARLIARLDESLRLQETAVTQGDAAQFARADSVFHDILLSALGYGRVKNAVHAARAKVDRAREFLLRAPERQLRSFIDHVAIVDALKRRDAEAAQDAMTRHLDRAALEIATRAAEHPQIFAPPAEADMLPAPERGQLHFVS